MSVVLPSPVPDDTFDAALGRLAHGLDHDLAGVAVSQYTDSGSLEELVDRRGGEPRLVVIGHQQ